MKTLRETNTWSKTQVKTWALMLTQVALLAACGTKTVSETEPVYRPLPSTPSTSDNGVPQIDLVALRTSLGLDRSNEQLGYEEKAFDTCHAGFGYSPTKDCRRQVFVVLNFRLMCRDSEGTVSQGINNSEMMAISRRPVRWNLKGLSGTTETDSEGFGQIVAVSSFSQKRERVKLGVGNDFLYMRANEITKVVTPRPWCN